METGGPSREPLDWRMLCIGIILSLALAAGIGWIGGRENTLRSKLPHEHVMAAKEHAARFCQSQDLGKVIECAWDVLEAGEQRAHDEQDLSAQQRAATAALVAAMISFMALIVTAIGVWFVKQTLEATLVAVRDTSKATLAMERQNELVSKAQRPWLDIEVLSVTPWKSGKLSLEASVTNHSMFPTHDVRVVGIVYFIDTSLLEMDHLIDHNTEVAELFDVTIMPGGAVFPQRTVNTGTIVGVEDPRSLQQISHGPPAMLWIGVRYAFDGGLGFTYKRYWMTNTSEALTASEQFYSGAPLSSTILIPQIVLRLEERSIIAK